MYGSFRICPEPCQTEPDLCPVKGLRSPQEKPPRKQLQEENEKSQTAARGCCSDHKPRWCVIGDSDEETDVEACISVIAQYESDWVGHEGQSTAAAVKGKSPWTVGHEGQSSATEDNGKRPLTDAKGMTPIKLDWIGHEGQGSAAEVKGKSPWTAGHEGQSSATEDKSKRPWTDAKGMTPIEKSVRARLSRKKKRFSGYDGQVGSSLILAQQFAESGDPGIAVKPAYDELKMMLGDEIGPAWARLMEKRAMMA